MRTLIAWDDPTEAELLSLYLSASDNKVSICLSPEDLFAQLEHGHWDVVMLTATYPGKEADGFPTYVQIQERLPGVPVVLACRAAEMLKLPRFLNCGLRFYLVRDEAGDFVFLTLSTLEAAVEAARAEEGRKLAERLREEMEGVRRLQESIIPHGIKAPREYRISARYEPSQVKVVGHQPVIMAGGDYYDVFQPDERTLVVLVGDASGHGLKACMSIMAMHTLVKMLRGDRLRNTAAFVAEINQRLCDNSIVHSDGGFITLFYAAIDTVTHVMRWTSAGHPLAMLHNLATNEVTPVGTIEECGVPLGIYPDVDYLSPTLELPSDSRILIYSDGLTDALPMGEEDSEAFGIEGVAKTLRNHARDPVDQALERLFRASNAFTGVSGRHDDTSVVLLERCATSPVAAAPTAGAVKVAAAN